MSKHINLRFVNFNGDLFIIKRVKINVFFFHFPLLQVLIVEFIQIHSWVNKINVLLIVSFFLITLS